MNSLFEDIAETIREPLLVLDSYLKVISASRSFYRVFKVKPEETVGQLIYDLGNKQWNIPKLRELLETILPEKTRFDNYEVEHDFATIGKRTMLLNARQIERAMGKERIIILAIEDITEHKMAEAPHRTASANTQSQYDRSLIEASLDPLVTISAQGKITDVNEASVQVTGVTRKKLIGSDFSDFFTEPDKARQGYQKVFSEGFVRDYPLAIRHTTGRITDVLYNAAVYKNDKGDVLGVFAAARDVTKRKKIEAGLGKTIKELAVIKKTADEASEFAESIINTVREPLIVLDQDLRVVTVSRSFYGVFKVKPEETVGQLIYDLGNNQWDIPRLRELLETILPEKTSFDNYEVEHDFTTIGKRTMLLDARQIERAMGQERIILLAIEDITDRKKIEAGLGKAHEELKTLTTELKRVARVKSEFLANMSHELRTPLNSIIGFSEVLYDETFGPLNEKQRQYVNNVLTSGKHLLLLINQILDMAKVEAGKMKLSLSSLPMKGLLNEIALLLEDMVGKKRLEMLLEITEDLPDIEADDLKVKEILYNLLSNAVKFTPEGGKIGMGVKKADSEIEIVVWDTGIGIASENMDKIFEGFFRVDTPYSRVTEGTGLGLPLSKKLVELHGGTLFVESEGLDCGTSVRFTLPIISRMVV
ncbi:PAS domain-containing sensor histidine kinase [Patescibacteria group bacterium]|nr:PAS domain-containing sensor histidine kinase [Patescibacteria group bacterium]